MDIEGIVVSYIGWKGCMVYVWFCGNVGKKKKIVSYWCYVCGERKNKWIRWIKLVVFGCLWGEVNM